MRRQTSLFLFVGAVLLFSGCATLWGKPAAPTRPLTALEKAQIEYVKMSERYRIQYDDAKSLEGLVLSGKAAPAQIKVYRVKREILKKVKPLLDDYDTLILKGQVPGPGQEQEINDYLNELAAMAAG